MQSAANYFHILDKVTQEIVRHLVKKGEGNGEDEDDEEEGKEVPHTSKRVRSLHILFDFFPSLLFSFQVILSSPPSMANLQRARRTFLSIHRQLAKLPGGGEAGFGVMGEEGIANSFVEYLNTSY